MSLKTSKTAAAVSSSGNTKNQSAILVIGMHRSGTSALTKVLSFLGCELPKTLMPATEANENGYWESSPISELNERILRSGGSGWRDWHAFNPDWLNTPTCDSFVQQAIQLLEDEFGEARLFVLKDPRICLLLPFWQRVFAETGTNPLALHITRNPIEVAASLAQRDNFSTIHSYLLWLRYTLDGEYGTRGLPRSFITYEALLENPDVVVEKAQEHLKLKWPRYSARVQHEIRDFISTSLRHHKTANSSLVNEQHANPWLQTTYDILLANHAKPIRKQDLVRLDQIRNALTAAALPFSQSISELGPLKSQTRELTNALASAEAKHKSTLQSQQSAAKTQLETVTTERDVLKAEKQELIGAHEALKQMLSQEKARIEDLEDARNILANDKRELSETLNKHKEQSTDEIGSLESQLGVFEDEKQSLTTQQNALQEKLDQATQNLRKLKSERDTLRTEKDALDAKLGTAKVAHKATQAQLVAMTAEQEALAGDNRKLRNDFAALKQKRKQEKTHVEGLEAKHTALEGENQRLSEALQKHNSQSETRIATLMRQLNTLEDERKNDHAIQVSLQENIEQAVTQLSQLQADHDMLAVEKKTLSAEKETLDAKLAAGETAHKATQAQLVAMTTEQEVLAADNRKLKNDFAALKQKRKQEKTQAEDLEAAYTALEGENQRLSETLQKHNSQSEEQVATLIRQLNTLEDERKNDHAIQVSLQENIEQAVTQLNQLQAGHDVLTAEKKTLSAENEVLLSSLKKARAQKDAQQADVQGLIASLSNLETKLEEKSTQAAEAAHQLTVTQSELRQRQHESDQTAEELIVAHKRITDLNQHLERTVDLSIAKDLEEQLQSLQATLEHQSGERVKHLHKLEQLQKSYNELDGQLSTSFNEIAVLSDILATAEKKSAELINENGGLLARISTLEPLTALLDNISKGDASHKSIQAQIQAVLAVLMEQCGRPYLSKRALLRRQTAVLRATGLLDVSWYQTHNTDIIGTGISAETHFILFGNTEGRAPNPVVARLTEVHS